MPPVVVFDTNILFSTIGWRDRRHVLPLGSYKDIAIVSAADFLANIASVP